MHTVKDKKLLMLKPSQIFPSPEQPRKTFDEYELNSLAESIAANGIIQPLSVRKAENGTFELIAGERRLRAAKMVGVRRIPCVVHDTDGMTAALYSIIENLQRSDLTFFEEADAIGKLIIESGLMQSEMAVRLGMAQSTLSNKLRLLKLSDDLREKIVAAKLSERHARALLCVPPENRDQLLKKIIAEGMSLRETEQAIGDMMAKTEEKNIIYNLEETEKQKPVRKAAIGNLKLFTNSLTKLIVMMNESGLDATTRRNETEKYIEYRVRIPKNGNEARYQQLKIC